MRMFVAQHKDTVRVIRRHQPRMHCNLSEKIDRADTTPRCRFVRASLCASDLGKGWEMDDWMFAHAREGDDIDLVAAAEEIGMDGTAFGSCLRDPAAFDRAQAEVDAAKAAKIRATPMYVIDGETMDHPTAIETLRARL
jgi:predicted DsbA family dithiol-disulfide isomerase